MTTIIFLRRNEMFLAFLAPLFRDGFSKTRKETAISFLFRNEVVSSFLESNIAKSLRAFTRIRTERQRSFWRPSKVVALLRTSLNMNVRDFCLFDLKTFRRRNVMKEEINRINNT